MLEHAALYKIEGFTNVEMQNVFTSLLTITPQSYLNSDTTGQYASKKSQRSTCASTSGQTPLTISDPATPPTPTSFLKTMLTQQLEATKALMDTAKRIGPATQKAVQREQAYSAAFESDTQAPIPSIGATLQSFVLLFFSVSYVALAIVSSIMVNIVTGSTRKALATFTGFILMAIITFILLVRLG